MPDTDPKAAPLPSSDPEPSSVPGSASRPHPAAAIPLPAHGFEGLADTPLGELTGVPSTDVITSAAVLLMGASAENLGLAAHDEPTLDLDEARALITALAGLLAATQDYLGERREPLHEGLRSLQAAFRHACRYPDEPGNGPGEQYLS